MYPFDYVPFLDPAVLGPPVAAVFGAYGAEKIFRGANLRVLVLEAGPFLVSEHTQNLARIGLNVPGAASVIGERATRQGEVWTDEHA